MDCAYLWTQVVDKLNGLLKVASIDEISYLYPLLDRAVVLWSINIGFHCKLLSSRRVALGDQVVHNQVIDVSEQAMLANIPQCALHLSLV